MVIENWIIDCLQNHGNVSLPRKLVKKNGIDKVQKELSSRCGFNVAIKTDIVARDKSFGNSDLRKFVDVFYIAERENKYL